MTALTPHDRAAVDALRAELAEGTRVGAGRQRDWHGLDPRDMRPLLPDPWLCPDPDPTPEQESRWDWEDAGAERLEVDDYSPDDDRPHAGGSRWERLLAGGDGL